MCTYLEKMNWIGSYIANVLLITIQFCVLSQNEAIPMPKTDRYISLSEYNNNTYKFDIMRKAKVAEIQNYMDESVDPCTDFYQFACGRWSKINAARSEPTTGFFENLSNGFSFKVSKLLNETDKPNDPDIDKAIKRFYKSCIKMYDIPIKEHKAELIAIMQQYGQMPALVGPRWNDKNFDWLETIARIQHDYFIQIIIGTDIMMDFKDNKINRLYVGQAELMLESKSMYKDESNEKYRKLYIKKITDNLKKHLQLSEINATKTAKEIVEFECFLANGLQDDHTSQSLNQSTILTTAEQLTAKYGPAIDFKKYLRITFGEDIKEPLYEYYEQFQKNLKFVIERTPKSTVANYVFYKLIARFLPKVSKDRTEQLHSCEGVVGKYFTRNLDNMIYRRYNTKDTERDVNTIWHQIKEAFRRKLNSNELSWILSSTRQTAMKKLDSMQLEINTYSNINFTEEYADLVIDDTNYIINLQSIYRHNAKKTIAKLHEPPKPFEAGEELSYTPANVILENKIKIPVSLLQPNYLWGENYPTALKFGTLGFLIGHELLHGFDDAGRDYDENGNQREWWDEKSMQEFNDRTECFKLQYHQYIFGGSFLPLNEAQAENIADNGGIKLAYDAYMKWLDEAVYDIQSETFSEIKYTNKQLFFISYAQIWCSDTHPTMKELQMATDEHTPSIYRVIGVLSNFPEFEKEFQCPTSSDMVPSLRCEIY